MPTAFLTVGSTKFEALVRAADTEEVARALTNRGFDKLVLQTGYGAQPVSWLLPRGQSTGVNADTGLHVEVTPYEASIQGRLREADLVISHAGAGSLFEALRMGKAVIAVPNPSLMGNHQQGLADELSRSRYLFTCSAGDLARTIASYDPARLRPYEGGDPKAAARAVQGAVWEQDASPRPQPAVSPVTGFEIIIVIALSVLLSSLWVWVNNTKDLARGRDEL